MTENSNNFHRINTHCIFCAKETPSFESVSRNLAQPTGEPGEDEENLDKPVERHRLSVTMAGKILGVEDSVKQKRLSEFGPNAKVDRESPDLWVKICLSCNEFVDDHIASKKEIARLERGAKKIEVKLKEFIVSSNQEGKDETVDKSNSIFWKEIREQVVRAFPPAEGQEAGPSKSNIPGGAQKNVEHGTVRVLSKGGQPVKRKSDSLVELPPTIVGVATQDSSSASSVVPVSGGEIGSESHFGVGSYIDSSYDEDEDEEDIQEMLYRCKICATLVTQEEKNAHRIWHLRNKKPRLVMKREPRQ
ncbi:unnamed protein product [Orchesella dallaii]|uniref:C2H2-type domain-containing protein n=1 Tax=Orchesella dallaii TaxID=48710 RepID=A0ABP1PIG4_9HEXA